MEFVRARDLQAGSLIIGQRTIVPEVDAEVVQRAEFGLIVEIQNPEQIQKYILWLGCKSGKLLAVEHILNQEVFDTGQCPVITAKPYDLGTVSHLDDVVADAYQNRPIMKGSDILFYVPQQARTRISDHHQFMLFNIHGRHLDTQNILNLGSLGVIEDWTVRLSENAGFELDLEGSR